MDASIITTEKSKQPHSPSSDEEKKNMTHPYYRILFSFKKRNNGEGWV